MLVSKPPNPDALPATSPPRADWVLFNGKIWTGAPLTLEDPRRPAHEFVEAVAGTGERILALGSLQELQPYLVSQTVLLDLHGQLALPGFIDSHVHFLEGGFQLQQLNLSRVESQTDFVTRLAGHAASVPPGQWILGGGWDENAWPLRQLPTRWLIDPVTPHHPVFLRRADGHAALANSLALRRAGLTRATASPPGGEIVRDPASGEPTGVLKDQAQDLVARRIPPPTEAATLSALRLALAEASRCGVTSVHNMDLGRSSQSPRPSALEPLLRARAEGWLTCRFYEFIPAELGPETFRELAERMQQDALLRLGGWKAFADGSLGSRTAWMDEAYADALSNFGLPMPWLMVPGRLQSLVRDANRAPAQLAVHAIGTRAVHEILTTLEAVAGTELLPRRFRLEHAQHMRPEEFARLARLDVIASMQPHHAVADGCWAESCLGSARARWSYAWRAVLDAGAKLAFGSDWPVAPLAPLLGIYAALTRATFDGKHPGGWIPEQKISLRQALGAYTSGAAFAEFQENEKGTLAPGKLADIVVLSADLFALPPEKIKDVCVTMTMVGGKIVYQAT